jgi:FkbM family methyltransferase
MVPRPEDEGTHVLAFEPLPSVQSQIPAHDQISLIPAAFSDKSGLTAIYEYGDFHQSSSLAKLSEGLSSIASTGKFYLVPSLSLVDILTSIPREVEIKLVKIDIQGYDFKVVSSAGQALAERGVRRVVTEVYIDNTQAYDGVENDYCLHWRGYMESIGYKLIGLAIPPRFLSESDASALCSLKHEQSTGVKEANAYWQLGGDEPLSLETFEYPTLWRPEVFQAMEKLWKGGGSSTEEL